MTSAGPRAAAVVASNAVARLDMLMQEVLHHSTLELLPPASDLLSVIDRAADAQSFVVVVDDTFSPGDIELLLRILNRFVDPPKVIVVAEDARSIVFADAPRVTLSRAALPPRRPTLAEVLQDVRDPGDLSAIREAHPVSQLVPADPAQVVWAKATGDYIRIYLRAGGSMLVRRPISAIESDWAGSGFIRTHRAYLVAMRDVINLRTVRSSTVVTVTGGASIPVSRRRRAEVIARLRSAQSPSG
jgi:hypothetical protein